MKKAHIENTATAHLTYKNYLIGFVLAVCLTIISFGLVWLNVVSKQIAVTGIFVAAAAQIAVHLHYFLHLDRSRSQRWNVITIAFTALLLFVFIAGTVWVMHTLNTRMM